MSAKAGHWQLSPRKNCGWPKKQSSLQRQALTQELWSSTACGGSQWLQTDTD